MTSSQILFSVLLFTVPKLCFTVFHFMCLLYHLINKIFKYSNPFFLSFISPLTHWHDHSPGAAQPNTKVESLEDILLQGEGQCNKVMLIEVKLSALIEIMSNQVTAKTVVDPESTDIITTIITINYQYHYYKILSCPQLSKIDARERYSRRINSSKKMKIKVIVVLV